MKSKGKRPPSVLAEPKPKVRKSPGKQKRPPTANTVLTEQGY